MSAGTEPSSRLALFDCDGTLVDGQASICLAMEDCFARAGLEPPARERTRRVVGLSLVEAMRAMLPEGGADLHARLAEDYKAAFHDLRRRGLVEEPLYEGMRELLDALEEKGWQLGIATGKSDRGLRLCLEAHGLAGRFATLQTADRHPSKPHPSMIEAALAETGSAPELSMMIGDTRYDMAMAKAAGVMAVGVAWGYHAVEELLSAGADYVAARPGEIAALAKAVA
ncbi:MAG: HAD-IA family hydrolase [Alphaproteobacteria bacterium]|nr:HAD-IA family hydrolase [Alphaproteobacteria bacterium]MBV9371596.1 HAD-IA family hydrolase [Alphaproteobacteria bacterium]MBV9902205.1 HAD-IA family hydrolase [Alphaproteobacteria bacterium]